MTRNVANTAPGPAKWRPGTYLRDPVAMLTGMHRTYGGISRVKFGPFLMHVVTEPAYVKHVLQDNAHNYVRGRLYKMFEPFFGLGLLTTDDEEWRFRRKVSQPLFHRPKLREKSSVITGCAQELASDWLDRADRGELIDVSDDLIHLAMGIFSRMFLGCDIRTLSDELRTLSFIGEAVFDISIVNQLTPDWVPTRRKNAKRRCRRLLDRVMTDIIDKHTRGEITEQTAVSAMLSARDDRGRPWSRAQVLADMKTLFLAGHETTGCALIWTLYSLAQNPSTRIALERELDEALGGRTPTVDDLPRLTYLRALVDESLRLHPPIWGFRCGRSAVQRLQVVHLRGVGLTRTMLPSISTRVPDRRCYASAVV